MWERIRPWLFPVWCIGCGASDIALCAGCAQTAQAARVEVDGIAVHAASGYDGVVRSAILGLKRGERAYLDPLAMLMAPLVPSGVAVVPLPTTRRRAAGRGFDQARELARRVCAQRDGWVADVLRKRGTAQHGRGRGERLVAAGRFRLRAGAELPDRAVLLDDVITTGATLRDAAATLWEAGCCVTGAVVLARTPPGRETPRAGRRLVEA